MKKLLTFILAISMIFGTALAEIDLSSMTDLELQALQEKIAEELERRKPVITETEKERRDRISDHFCDLVENYSFQTIIDEINAGDSGLSAECQADVLDLATRGAAALDGMNIETDIFSGEVLIKHPLALTIGNDTAVVPYLTDGKLGLIVGFTYDDSFGYDEILIKKSDDILSYSRKNFDIEFERIDGESWEYTYLSYINIASDDHIEAIGFREKDTTRKVDHLLTDAEKQATDHLILIEGIREELRQRFLHWEYTMDPSESVE